MSNLPKVRWKKNEFGQDRLQYLEQVNIYNENVAPPQYSHTEYIYKDVPTVNSYE